MKVTATLSAKKLLNDLKKVHGNDLLFHQSLSNFFADNVAVTFIFIWPAMSRAIIIYFLKET